MSTMPSTRKVPVKVTDDDIISYLQLTPSKTASEISKHFNVSSSIMFDKLNKLENKEKIVATIYLSNNGRKARHYKVAKNSPNLNEEAKEVSMIKAAPIESNIGLSFTPTSQVYSLDALITEAAHNIAQRMLEQIKQELTMGIEDLALEVAPKITRDKLLTTHKEKVIKPKVLITGLLSNQAGIISSEFHELFDLEFWNDRTGSSIEQLRSMSKRADVILYHKNHAAHNHQEVIKSVGGNMRIVSGGVSSMKDALTDLYVNGVK